MVLKAVSWPMSIWPQTCSPPLQPEHFQPLRIFRGEPRRGLRAQHFQIPGVRFAGGDPLRLERHGKQLARDRVGRVAQQRGVVPRLAGGDRRRGRRAARGRCSTAPRAPFAASSRAKRHVADVHAQVAHAAVLGR